MSQIYRVAVAFLALLLVNAVRGADEPTWSNSDTEQTPQGNVTFHGPFSNETIEVASGKLAPVI